VWMDVEAMHTIFLETWLIYGRGHVHNLLRSMANIS
jgi:hypothetical protein